MYAQRHCQPRIWLMAFVKGPAPVRPCLDCAHATPTVLAPFSESAQILYVRCPECGCVWTVAKNDLAGEQRRVTEARPRQ